jgi:hypothetical protein
MTTWGWMNVTPKGSKGRSGDGNVHWVGGTLAESYERVAAHGGSWRLVSADPVAHYYAALAAIEEQCRG